MIQNSILVSSESRCPQQTTHVVLKLILIQYNEGVKGGSYDELYKLSYLSE